jgi:gas vesicle protein
MHDADVRTQSGSGRGFLVGLLCGAAVGATAGLLLAQRPGRELRQDMAASAGRLKRRASAAYDQASTAIDDIVGRSRHAWEAGRDAFRTTRTEGAPAPVAINAVPPAR